MYRTVGTGGSFGANHFQKRIGLGKSAKIVQLKVRWRASNSRQNFSNVEKRQFIEIKEFAKNWTTLARKPFRLGPVNHQQRLCPFTGAGFALEWRELGRRHGSRTMRQGRIAANLEGNEYTAKQLGDLTEAVMAR